MVTTKLEVIHVADISSTKLRVEPGKVNPLIIASIKFKTAFLYA